MPFQINILQVAAFGLIFGLSVGIGREIGYALIATLFRGVEGEEETEK